MVKFSKGVSNAQTNVDNIREQITADIERIERAQTNLNSAGAIIDDCQRIAAAVRERGPEKTKGN